MPPRLGPRFEHGRPTEPGSGEELPSGGTFPDVASLPSGSMPASADDDALTKHKERHRTVEATRGMEEIDAA
jgi:hypothetical protein